MRLVGACCSGIAHTYMAIADFESCSEELGFDLACSRTIGAEPGLLPKDIETADASLFLANTKPY